MVDISSEGLQLELEASWRRRQPCQQRHRLRIRKVNLGMIVQNGKVNVSSRQDTLGELLVQLGVSKLVVDEALAV